MGEEGKTNYPMMPVKHWWALRKKFKQSIPGTVTDNYLATSLDMELKSARTNILPFLQQMGITDVDGKTLDRAKQWRDDMEYPAVCAQILEDCYPADLRDAVPNPKDDKEAAKRWFANHTGGGQSLVNRMVAIYVVLTEADPNSEPETIPKKEPKEKKTPKKKSAAATKKATDVPAAAAVVPPANPAQSAPKMPDVNINLQIHISSDATPDQIDKIFESMSKHIYKSE